MLKEIIKRIIIFISTMLFGLFSSGSSNSKSDFSFESDLYGPFPQYSDDFDVEFKVIYSGIAFKFCSFGFNIYDDKYSTLYSGYESETYLITKTKNSVVTTTLQTKRYLNAKGENIEFYVKTNSNVILTSRFTLFPYLTGVINPLHITERTFQANAFCFDQNIVLKNEEYIFENDITYFHIDEYYRLTLYDIKFHYKTYAIPSYLNAYLMLENPPSIFSSLNKDENGNLLIPVQLNYDGDFITFCLNVIYFVEPMTLYMSNEPKDGYVETHYFYLPKNKKDILNDLKFTMYICDFGPCNYDFRWDIEYIVNQNLIGDCDDSDYCIIGDIS